MNSMNRKTKIDHGVLFHNTEWLLNVYIIQSNEFEVIDNEEAYNIIETFLDDIENNCISNEFIYFKTGFAFLHYGNRGVNLNIWHIGKWGNTYELFNRTWYCYNRDLNKMEALDDAEPVLSQYEIFYFNAELEKISEIVKESPEKETFRNNYLKTYAYK